MLYRVATEITGKSGIACWTAGAAAVRYAKRGVTFCHHVVSYCAAMCVCVRVCVCSGARVDCIRLLAPHLAVCHRQRGVCSQPVLRRVAVVPCSEVPPHTSILPHLWRQLTRPCLRAWVVCAVSDTPSPEAPGASLGVPSCVALRCATNTPSCCSKHQPSHGSCGRSIAVVYVVSGCTSHAWWWCLTHRLGVQVLTVAKLRNWAGLFFLGLAPYLYLPIAHSLNPRPGGWGNPSSLSGFWRHITRAGACFRAVPCCAVPCWCGVAAGCGCAAVREPVLVVMVALPMHVLVCVPVPVPVPVLPWALTHTSACWAP